MQNASGYARLTGVLLLLSLFAGFFGEMYVPMKIVVPGDAAVTAQNLLAKNTFFRFGFAAYLIEAICDIALSWTLYVLLRPVQPELSLLAAFFGLVGTAVFAAAEMFNFAAPLVLSNAAYLTSFSPEQRNAIALLAVRVYSLGAGAFMMLYGIPSIIRGYLIFRSDYLPRFIGILLMFAGACFVAKNVTVVLTPRYSPALLLAPMFLAIVSMTVWFLTRGVDVEKWTAKVALTKTSS
jgi:hypothetical protein